MSKNTKKAYLIGIKGVGMTALAQILQNNGISVSGSDTDEKFFTDEVLKELSIPFVEEFKKGNVPQDADLVIHSVAYNAENNLEIDEAQNRGVRMLTYPQALAELFNSHYGIAVCGSHGKSTTTAMLGHVLEQANYDPTVVVGSRVNQWGSNALVGNSKYFVIEADEYRESFLNYTPKIIVLTNIDYDHPDYFKTEQDYYKTFEKFTSRVDKENLITLEESVHNIEESEFKLSLPGKYNQKNALVAYKAAVRLGIDSKLAKKALENFTGLARRFEHMGEYNGAQLYDDYAHHPTEIKEMLGAAKEKYKDKDLLVLFQPHTFSRTEGLFDDFVNSFYSANKVYILNTYASAREKQEDISGIKLAQALDAPYFYNHKDVVDYFKAQLNHRSVLLTVGAGDAWQICEKLNQKKKILSG